MRLAEAMPPRRWADARNAVIGRSSKSRLKRFHGLTLI